MPSAAQDHSEERRRRERYLVVRRVTVIGSVIDFALGAGKIVVGAAVHSQALIADGLHSLSDLVTDIGVIWAAKHVSEPPDAEHPYGHQRIETMASVALGVVLVLVAGGIAYDALIKLWRSEVSSAPGPWSLAIVVASVISKEALYHYTARAARRLNSEMLLSNAWHHRTDAFSSLVVIAGLVGTMYGYGSLDAVAAIIVAGMITWVGWTIMRSGARELVDTAVDAEQTRAIKEEAIAVEGVADIHDLRTRRMGGSIVLDGHVLLSDPTVSVSEGHRIGEAVRKRLKKRFKDLTDITIHVDAEDDRFDFSSARLPLRAKLLERLAEYWKDIPAAAAVEGTVIHYLEGRVQVETRLSLNRFEDIRQAQQAARQLTEAAAQDPDIERIDISFR